MKCTILGKDDLLPEKVKPLFKKNGCTTFSTAESAESLKDGLGNGKHLIVYEWKTGNAENLRDIRILSGLGNGDKIKILVVTPEEMSEDKKAPAKLSNSKIITSPLSPPKVQAGLRMLLGSLTEIPMVETKYLGPLAKATQSIIHQMGKTVIAKKDVETGGAFEQRGEFSAAMPIIGKIQGYIVLSMDSALGFSLVNKMTGGKVNSFQDPTFQSGIMEMVNVISGQVQAAINKTDLDFDFETPVLWEKQKGPQAQLKNARTTSVFFETDEGDPVYLQLVVQEKAPSP